VGRPGRGAGRLRRRGAPATGFRGSAVAHLAGALGKPVWLLNRHDAEWRWLHERRDCPWYPTMRIFTQPAPCGWASVVAEISAQISGETMSFL